MLRTAGIPRHLMHRRKRERSGIVRGPRRSFPSHLKWIRGFPCAVEHHGGCEGRIEAAHVRRGNHAGVGQKPADYHALPLCSGHHAEQHRIGEESFERKYSVSLQAIASDLARRSPYRRQWEEEG